MNENELQREQLNKELEQIKSRDANKEGKRKIVSKDIVKQNIARSPDYGDRFIMRMFFEVQKPKDFTVLPPTTDP